jgi:hypothetical protein
MVTLKCQEITLVEQDRLEVERIAQIDKDIALNFEGYMEKFIGSFQTLLGNVSMVDKDLSGAMEEIKQIAKLAMSKQSHTIEMNLIYPTSINCNSKRSSNISVSRIISNKSPAINSRTS